MELTRHQKITYGIIAVLFLVFIAIMVYVQVLSTGREETTVTGPGVSVGGLQSSAAAQPFAADILRDPRYQGLDRSLVEQGRLPVRPPPARGKPNLF